MPPVVGVTTGPNRGASIVTGVSGQIPPPNPTTNPLTIDGPYDGAWRPPAGSTGVVIEVWGNGAAGGYGTTSSSAGAGGGAGGYAKYNVADAAWASGGHMLLHIRGADGADGDNSDPTTVKLSAQAGYLQVGSGSGGNSTGVGGSSAVVGVAGYLGHVADTPGGAGTAAVGSVGGTGGSAAGGGAGGAGGNRGEFGSPGAAPGGGGGGGGGDPFLGGAGAPGRITIAWTPPP